MKKEIWFILLCLIAAVVIVWALFPTEPTMAVLLAVWVLAMGIDTATSMRREK